MMKTVTNILIALAVGTAWAAFAASPAGSTAQPNIIIFLVDDMGLMDTSVPFITDNGGKPVRQALNEYYQTPNMERLAGSGIRFSQFYAHSVCSPTRISIMTGKNSARHRATNWIRPDGNNRGPYGPPDWNWEGLGTGDVTLPRLLKTVGYRTIHVGKAHFGPLEHEGCDPLNLGFDVNIGGGAAGQPGSYYGTDGFGHIRGSKLHAVPNLEKYHGQDIYLTEALTLEANAEITRAVEDQTPFFLNMAHYAVHAPFQADPRFAEHYADSDKAKNAQAFATMIEGMDKSLGDIMDHLKELGVAERTLILFLGDNGSDAPLGPTHGYTSSAPLRGKKGTHYEGGMRVPFIASWAQPDSAKPWQQALPIAVGAVQTQLGTIFDILPTVCDVAGVALPDGYVVDGVDLKPQLAGAANESRPLTFLNHFPHTHRSSYFTSFVEDGWKVIYHYPVEEASRYELFHLETDPFEEHDLAGDRPEELSRMMQALAKELGAMKACYPVQELMPVVPKE
jgi:arylsulfatase A-like enzyme